MTLEVFFSRNPWVKRAGIAALWAVNLYILWKSGCALWIAFNTAPVNSDAGTYLSIANVLREGWVPFRDFSSGYTPLALYIFSWARSFFPVGGQEYSFYLSVIFFLLLAECVLIYLILRQLEVNRALATFAAAWASVLLYRYEGPYIFLEPFVSFFSLLAFLLIITFGRRWWAVYISGACVACAFLCKQYGLAGLPVFPLYMWFERKSGRDYLKKVSIYLLGFLSPILLGLGYFSVFYHVSLWSLITDMSVSGYQARGSTDFSRVVNFVFHTCHFLFLAPLALVVAKQRERRFVLASCALLCGFGLSLYVRTFRHYFGLVIPYAVILEVVGILVLVRWKPIFLLLFIYLVYAVRYETYLYTYAFRPSISRDYQLELAKAINSVWPPGSEALVYADPWIVYLAKLHPVDRFKPGFGFLSNHSAEEQREFIRKSSRILIDPKDRSYCQVEEEKINQKYGSFYDLLKEEGFVRLGDADGREFWERR